MSEPRTFATLSSGLLARKGAAKPAMRSQVHGFGQGDVQVPPTYVPGALDDLGWNDHGHDVPAPVASLAAAREGTIGAAPAAVLRAVEPVVLRQREALAEAVQEAASTPVEEGNSTRSAASTVVSTMLAGNRRAAFTLRVDEDRHMRLRLACAMQNRSAQQIVTEALDRMLGDLPGLDDLTRRVRRS